MTNPNPIQSHSKEETIAAGSVPLHSTFFSILSHSNRVPSIVGLASNIQNSKILNPRSAQGSITPATLGHHLAATGRVRTHWRVKQLVAVKEGTGGHDALPGEPIATSEAQRKWVSGNPPVRPKGIGFPGTGRLRITGIEKLHEDVGHKQAAL
ncbi:hypothetical protein D8674_013876 [Pyrus ussuriensis x Pyrus communis]|uniref:Uncharacterized protein n=1 Tax=Pyrus ussuriensis x Pyrus communis TaxID=2448454 RepID=A0A5N5GS70_9ROSA|nr:hypothetical protein D8674_013876 [Pyrus ussuriensis x Pyrus communis]